MQCYSSGTSHQTLEELLEQRIFNKLSAKFQELESNTKKQINDLRNDTNGKLKRLDSSDESSGWNYFKSGISETANGPSKDDPSIFHLSQDLYSVLATASWRSFPFWISMLIIFGFQFSLLVLLLANQVDVNSDNPLNLPANVEVPVRISQVLLIIIALFSQDDLLVGVESLVDGFPDLYRGNIRFSSMTRLQWRLSSIIQMSQGLLNLLAAFVISIQSETVPDVLLNVLGVGFISNLDDLAFRLSMKGYFGGPMKRIAEDICDARFYRTTNSHTANSVLTHIKGSAHIVIAFVLLLWGIAAFSIFAVQQDIGLYSEQDVRIEFGDEVLSFLGLFNGCYQASDSNENIAGRLVYEQVGYPNGGKFGFCADFGEGDSGWAFFIGEPQDDICKNYVLRSGETPTFSVLEAGKADWYTSDDLPLDSLEITEIKTPTSECGQSIFNTSTCPSLLAFDWMRMLKLPVSVDMKSVRSLDASVSHAIYYSDETMDGEVERFALMFFTGRRWIQTSSDHIPPLKGNETRVSDIQDFFVSDGLFSFIDHLRASADGKTLQWASAVSESVETARDQGSPLGLQWYFPRYETIEGTAQDENLQRNFPSADLARPMDTSLTCLYCNGDSNPCLHGGVCDNDSGKCDCKYGTGGNLCQILPLGNGICNLYFNKAEYSYDGGDCCGGTCVGGRCGEDDLPDPFVSASADGDRFYSSSISNGTIEWKETFRGREFAFGVDVDSDSLRYDGLLPLRYSHCKDPGTALLIIEQEGGSSLWTGVTDLGFTGTSVRCDGTLYLRTPGFAAKPNNGTYAEKIRVPYGANCVVSIDEEAVEPSRVNYNVSLFAETQPVPFLQQEVESVQGPIRLHIPDSDCVWNVFVENLVFGFIDVQDDGYRPGLSLNWNGYLPEDVYTNFTKGVELGSICDRDKDELLERYALWKISKSLRGDHQSQNFYGHICDIPWSEESLSMICTGRRVSEFTIRNSNNLPSEIGRLTSLALLDLQYNQLASLPSEIGRLTSLTLLDLGYNQLTYIPSEIGLLPSLKRLQLNDNQLASLPSEIGRLASLAFLLLNENKLTSLPSEIGMLVSLSALFLHRNQLTSLPSEIGMLTSLIRLGVEDNQSTSLPSEIGRLTSLTELGLHYNQLTSLPSEIGRLASLKLLQLDDNQSTSLPSEIGRLTSLTWLGLRYNQLISLPSEIGRLASLSDLLVEQNQLASLPSEIGSLTALTRLGLDDNQLTSVPPEIGNLASLKRLLLNENKLTSLPSEIGTLTSMTWLGLGINHLEWLPSEIGTLVSLGALFLHRNQLTSLPSEIARSSSLTLLNLFFNPLTANLIPSEISKLPLLETLLVCGDDGGYGCNGDNSCTDIVGWLDWSGNGCDWYEAYGYKTCADDSITSNNVDGISANEACCICDGGTHTDGGE